MKCANVTKKESVMRACARDGPKMLYKSSPCHRKVAARYIKYHQKTRLCDRYLSNKGNGTFRRVAALQNVIPRHVDVDIKSICHVPSVHRIVLIVDHIYLI